MLKGCFGRKSKVKLMFFASFSMLHFSISQLFPYIILSNKFIINNDGGNEWKTHEK